MSGKKGPTVGDERWIVCFALTAPGGPHTSREVAAMLTALTGRDWSPNAASSELSAIATRTDWIDRDEIEPGDRQGREQYVYWLKDDTSLKIDLLDEHEQ